MTITNADIASRLKLLADNHLKVTSGTLTYITCTDLVESRDITGSFICFVSGANEGVDKIITAYDSSLGKVEFSNLSTAAVNTDEFCIVSKGFQSDILQAHSIVSNDMRNRGYDIDLFLNYATQLKELYIYKTIELVCAGLMNDGQDHDAYFVNYNRFKDLYDNEISTLVADYDENEDGEIGEDEELNKNSYGVLSR